MKHKKIAILCNFTIRNIEQPFVNALEKAGYNSEFYIVDHGSMEHESSCINSGLYEFNPDVVIIFNSFDYFKCKNPEDNIKSIEYTIDNVISNSDAFVIVHNLCAPVFSEYGLIEYKIENSVKKKTMALNTNLESRYGNNRRVIVFDYDGFCSKHGKKSIFNVKYYVNGNIHIRPTFLPSLCSEYVRGIKAFDSLCKKCIVLDLDNTLWGGIVGEDGIDGIKLSPSGDGSEFYLFQRALLDLYNRGIILAVNSKNNYEDAINVIKNHPFMLLREEHFSSIKINWKTKTENIIDISKQLNIGLDSMVFFDDDKVNRDMVSTMAPDVEVVDLPSDPLLYYDTIMELDSFSVLNITSEDLLKSKMYADQRKRAALESSSNSIDEYLSSLDIKVKFLIPNLHIPRIAQLCNKTNQFNMTVRRHSEKDIEIMMNDGYEFLCVEVSDKFGSNGLTGLAIYKLTDNLYIDTFLLSCRVIGRGIEKALLAEMIKTAKSNGMNVIMPYKRTQKNKNFRAFYEENGFKLKSFMNGEEIWGHDCDSYSLPSYIGVEYV